MKTRWIFAVAAAVAAISLTASRATAHWEVGVGVEINAATDFYEPLTAHGTWVEVGSYGRCWRPASIEVGWRPYCNGTWVATDAGWYWQSDEPWGWACYHYGRWTFDTSYGWVWVPGVEWAPSWVSWREGGGYIGWAPLPPQVGFHGEVIVASQIDIAPASFVFIGTSHFLEPVRPRTVIVNNTTIVNKTVNITKIHQETKNITNVGSRKVIVNEGPRTDVIEKATARSVRPEPIHQVAQQAAPPATIREKAPKQPKENDRRQPRELTPTQTQPQREIAPPAPQREVPAREPQRVAPPPERPDDSTNRELKREKPPRDAAPTREHPDAQPPRQQPPASGQIKRPPPEQPTEDSPGKGKGKKPDKGEEGAADGEQEQPAHGRGHE